jgi:hypothetical protein
MPGNTRTGGVLEAMILPALLRGGYRHRAQVVVGDRLGCGKHVVDAIAEKDGREVLVSVKWQQVAGTAEQKVPFELICLLDALERGPYVKAYLVLGGEGWKTGSLKEETVEVWEKDPSVHAFADLMNRTIDKPSEQPIQQPARRTRKSDARGLIHVKAARRDSPDCPYREGFSTGAP